MSYLDMLRTLDEDGDSSEMPKSPAVETVETPSKPSIDGLDGSPSGTFQKITPPEPPPDLTDDERADLREALDERAAIMEFDGGLPRPEAETQAVRLMRVYRVRVAMGENEPDRWTVMLAPGCDLPEAQHAAALQFGPERVRELVEVQR